MNNILKMIYMELIGELGAIPQEGNRMPRRSILSAAERESLLALPDTKDELIRHYTFSESDLGFEGQ